MAAAEYWNNNMPFIPFLLAVQPSIEFSTVIFAANNSTLNFYNDIKENG